MDAVKYLKEKKRMCSKYKLCEECPMSLFNNGKEVNCQSLESSCPEEAVAIVEKWSAEHPVKTRQSEFLKMFPEAKVENGLLKYYPCDMNTLDHFKDSNCERFRGHCYQCRKDFWLAEVE